jgi:hypothetical protein
VKRGLRYYLNLIFLIGLIIAGVIYRGPLYQFAHQQYLWLFPCKSEIAYTIGTIDPQFNLSKTQAKDAINEAVALWEKPYGKKLFRFVPSSNDNPDLVIHFTFDTRQETTNTLNKISNTIDSTNAQYNTLKREYEQLISRFETEKAHYEMLASDRSTDRKVLEQKRNELNNMVNQINMKANELNIKARGVNTQVGTFNTINDTLGSEFEEGLYTRTNFGQTITIFQYDTKERLVRVLAHEFGHALGLDHIDNSAAIMYKTNSSTNLQATPADTKALKTLCKSL